MSDIGSGNAENMFKVHKELESLSSEMNPFIKVSSDEYTKEEFLDVGKVNRIAKILSTFPDNLAIKLLDFMASTGIITIHLESEILSSINKFSVSEENKRMPIPQEIENLSIFFHDITGNDIDIGLFLESVAESGEVA